MSISILADTHISRVIVSQLRAKSVDAVHLEEITVLPNNAPDEVILEYATLHNRSVLSLDDDFRNWHYRFLAEQKDHAGIFLGDNTMQGDAGIGIIVRTIVEYHQLADMADMLNQLIEINR